MDPITNSGTDKTETFAKKAGTTRSQFIKRAAISGVGLAGVSSVLAACGDSGPSGAVAAGPTLSAGERPKIAAKYKNKTIGVPIYSGLDENEPVILHHLEAASENAGLQWKFISNDTKADQAAAESTVQSYLNRNVDAIIDIVVPAAYLEAQFAAAKKKGIPVIGNYTFPASNSSITADYSPPLDMEEVPMSHYLINDQQQRLGRKGVKVAMMDVPLEVVEPRHWSFEAICPHYEGVEIVEKDFNVDPTNLVADATRRAKAILQKNPDLSCIWVGFPPLALPVASAIAQEGKSDIQVYGHATGVAGAEAVQEQNTPMVATTWVDFPYSAYGMVDLVLQALSGAEVSKQASYLRPVPTTVFGPENIEQEIPKGTDPKDWTFAEGTYISYFMSRWQKYYGS